MSFQPHPELCFGFNTIYRLLETVCTSKMQNAASICYVATDAIQIITHRGGRLQQPLADFKVLLQLQLPFALLSKRYEFRLTTV